MEDADAGHGAEAEERVAGPAGSATSGAELGAGCVDAEPSPGPVVPAGAAWGVEELVDAADALQASGLPEDAAHAQELYSQALAQKPNHARALSHLARLLQTQGSHDLAEELYQRAMGLPAESKEAAIDMLNCYAVLLHSWRKDYAQAAALYKEVLRHRPDDADTHCNYATLILEVRGPAGTAEAEAHLLRALELRPDDTDALFNYAVLQQELRGDWERAGKALARVLELQPEDLEAAYNHAVIQLEAEKDYGKAERLCQRILAASPEDMDALYAYGDILAQRRPEGERDLARAAEMYRRALAVQPDHADVLANLAIVLMEQRDMRGALDALQRVAAVAPDHPLATTDGAETTAAALVQQLSLFLRRPIATALDASPEAIATALDPARLFTPARARASPRSLSASG